MDEKKKQELIEQGWDPRFSNGVLGVTNAVDLQPSADADDPFQGGPYGSRLDQPPENTLKKFVANLGEKDIAEITSNSHDPETRRKGQELLKDLREGEAAKAFTEAHPEYLATDSNYSKILEALQAEDLPMSLDSLEAVYAALSADGELDVPDDWVKELSDRELLHVARLSQQGKIADAIGTYLHYALPSLSAKELFEATQDPDLLPLTNQAVYTVFANSTPDFQDTDEARDYLLEFADGRPLSYALLQEGWKAMRRDAVLRTENQPEPKLDVDSLSGEEAERLYRAALRERARRTRR